MNEEGCIGVFSRIFGHILSLLAAISCICRFIQWRKGWCGMRPILPKDNPMHTTVRWHIHFQGRKQPLQRWGIEIFCEFTFRRILTFSRICRFLSVGEEQCGTRRIIPTDAPTALTTRQNTNFPGRRGPSKRRWWIILGLDKRAIFWRHERVTSDRDAASVFSLGVPHNFRHLPTAHTPHSRTDFSQFKTVMEVEAYVASQPVADVEAKSRQNVIFLSNCRIFVKNRGFGIFSYWSGIVERCRYSYNHSVKETTW